MSMFADRYHLTTRVGPALLGAMPLSVLLVVCAPFVTSWLGAIGVCLASGLPLVAAQVVRDQGAQEELALFASWGGRPSEAMLRWRAAPSVEALRRRHDLVARHLGIELPDQEIEASDPGHADALYEIASTALRERTRDKSRFPLLFNENVAYGFRRNALSCRPIAWAACGMAAAGAAVAAISGLVPLDGMTLTLLIAFDAATAIGWWLLCTPAAVRRAANAYARQLFACLESIDDDARRSPASSMSHDDCAARDLGPYAQPTSADSFIQVRRSMTAAHGRLLRKANVSSVLFLSADPTDASRLRLGQELREIREKLRLAQLRDRFELHQRTSIRPVDVSQALLDVRPRIVHFAGHGNRQGELCLESPVGTIQPVAPDALSELFLQFRDDVGCVLLNACYSAAQASAIARHIEHVIGMDRAIGDEAAIAFAIGFYQAIGAGRSVPEAFELGRVLIRLHGMAEHMTPVLLSRGQGG